MVYFVATKRGTDLRDTDLLLKEIHRMQEDKREKKSHGQLREILMEI